MTRRGRTVLIVVMLLSSALGLAFYLLVWPWLRFPDQPSPQILARWAAVEQRAATFGDPGPQSPRLAAAIAAIETWPDPGDELSGTRLDQPLELASLDPAARRALDELLAWAREGGGIGDDCTIAEPRTLVGMSAMRLIQLAIRTAKSPDDPALVAALRLAAAYRRHGTAMAAIIGFKTAEGAVEFVRARGWAPGGALVELRPTAEELRVFAAREIACTFRVHESLLSDGCERPNPDGTIPWYHPLSQQRWCQRERLVFQWFYGDLFTRADAEQDLLRFGAALDLENDNTKLPPSFMLQSNYCDPGEHVDELAAVIAAYDAYLAGAAPTAP